MSGMTDAAQDGHVHPTESQIKALVVASESDAGPIVMTNLLRFHDGGGRAAYMRYSEAVQPHLDRVGATVVYVGNASQTVIGDQDGTWWDTILLVRYPSRARFVEMISDTGYQQISGLRTAALTDSALIVTEPWDVEMPGDEP